MGWEGYKERAETVLSFYFGKWPNTGNIKEVQGKRNCLYFEHAVGGDLRKTRRGSLCVCNGSCKDDVLIRRVCVLTQLCSLTFDDIFGCLGIRSVLILWQKAVFLASPE